MSVALHFIRICIILVQFILLSCRGAGLQLTHPLDPHSISLQTVKTVISQICKNLRPNVICSLGKNSKLQEIIKDALSNGIVKIPITLQSKKGRFYRNSPLTQDRSNAWSVDTSKGSRATLRASVAPNFDAYLQSLKREARFLSISGFGMPILDFVGEKKFSTTANKHLITERLNYTPVQDWLNRMAEAYHDGWDGKTLSREDELHRYADSLLLALVTINLQEAVAVSASRLLDMGVTPCDRTHLVLENVSIKNAQQILSKLLKESEVKTPNVEKWTSMDATSYVAIDKKSKSGALLFASKVKWLPPIDGHIYNELDRVCHNIKFPVGQLILKLEDETGTREGTLPHLRVKQALQSWVTKFVKSKTRHEDRDDALSLFRQMEQLRREEAKRYFDLLGVDVQDWDLNIDYTEPQREVIRNLGLQKQEQKRTEAASKIQRFWRTASSAQKLKDAARRIRKTKEDRLKEGGELETLNEPHILDFKLEPLKPLYPRVTRKEPEKRAVVPKQKEEQEQEVFDILTGKPWKPLEPVTWVPKPRRKSSIPAIEEIERPWDKKPATEGLTIEMKKMSRSKPLFEKIATAFKRKPVERSEGKEQETSV